jgi:hypothetical protein
MENKRYSSAMVARKNHRCKNSVGKIIKSITKIKTSKNV